MDYFLPRRKTSFNIQKISTLVEEHHGERGSNKPGPTNTTYLEGVEALLQIAATFLSLSCGSIELAPPVNEFFLLQQQIPKLHIPMSKARDQPQQHLLYLLEVNSSPGHHPHGFTGG